MSRPAPPIVLQDSDREISENWIRAHQTPQRLALRARAILLAAKGVSNTEIAAELRISRPTLLEWRRRFVEEGLNGLTEIRPGRGRKPKIPAEKIEAIVEATLVIRELTATINVRCLRKHPRGPTKPAPKAASNENQPHVSAARVIANRKRKN